jgi:hypothetical protein
MDLVAETRISLEAITTFRKHPSAALVNLQMQQINKVNAIEVAATNFSMYASYSWQVTQEV